MTTLSAAAAIGRAARSALLPLPTVGGAAPATLALLALLLRALPTSGAQLAAPASVATPPPLVRLKHWRGALLGGLPRFRKPVHGEVRGKSALDVESRQRVSYTDNQMPSGSPRAGQMAAGPLTRRSPGVTLAPSRSRSVPLPTRSRAPAAAEIAPTPNHPKTRPSWIRHALHPWGSQRVSGELLLPRPPCWPLRAGCAPSPQPLAAAAASSVIYKSRTCMLVRTEGKRH